MENWPIVTLTSDFGRRDYHLALLQGTLLRAEARIRLFDISHEIDEHDIVQAAFIFRNAWSAFPQGSIHVLSVNDYYGADTRFIAFSYQEHFFIGPDNGVFSLVFDELPPEVFLLPELKTEKFLLAEVYARAVAHIAQGKAMEEIGVKQEELTQRITFQPVIGPSYIRGSIMHIDRYENAVLNISKELFDRVGEGRKFGLYFKRHDPITVLSQHYHDVPVGEPLCRFGTAGLLEISINMGKAASLLGLKAEDHVQIDFTGRKPRKTKTKKKKKS